jgi:hypothetical protein
MLLIVESRYDSMVTMFVTHQSLDAVHVDERVCAVNLQYLCKLYSWQCSPQTGRNIQRQVHVGHHLQHVNV